MKTKKLAVQPISPAAAAALKAEPVERPFVPTNWEDAFADLSERMLRVVGHQQSKIQAQAVELVDARGIAAAAGRAHAELVERFDALVILVEKQAATITELKTAVAAVPDSITAAVAPQQTTAVELAALIQRVDHTKEVFSGQGESIDRARVVLDELGEKFDVLTRRVDDLTDVAEEAATTLTTVTKRVDGCVEVINGHGVTLGEHFDAIESLQGITAAAGAAAAVQVERVDDVMSGVQSLRTDVSAVVVALDAETAARTAAVAAVVQLVDDLSETASGEDGALSDRIAAVDQHFTAAAGKLESAVERVGAVENRVIELQRITMDHVERIDTGGDRIERIEETLTGFVAKIKAIAEEITAIDAKVKAGTASIAETADTTADMLRRVNVMLGEMPSAMMVDQDGELVRFSRSGDVAKLGKVVAHGRDGANAADIVAVKLDGNRLVFTRSDRTEFGCSIAALIQPAPATAPAAPEVDPTTLGYLSKDPVTRHVQVKDMVAMRAAKKNYKLIAEKYKISERQVVRLIKGHNDEEPSHT